MSSDMILHFSLGPVQGFIGQARRIRDYWAGSFLLSYLSGVAMRAVEEGFPFGNGRLGKVEFPILDDDPLWLAMHGIKPDWHIGTLPNRFRAAITVASPETVFKPRGEDLCTRAIQEAWWTIAEAVWEEFLEKLPWHEIGGDERKAATRAIWERQVRDFWEASWVLGESDDPKVHSPWLDRRKNWRSQPRSPEPGDHCRMMSEYQELSGYIRSQGAEAREQQEQFWDAVRARIGSVVNPGAGEDRDYDLLELRRTERLCAIALVKRLFPVLPAERLRDAVGWVPDGLVRRRDADARPGHVRYWPSVAYVAAVPWAKRAWYRLDKEACTRFADRCCNEVYVEAVAERRSRVASLAGEPNSKREDDPLKRFGALGGELFFADMLETDRRNAQREHGTADDQHVSERAEREISRKEKALAALKTLRDELEAARKRRALVEPTLRQAKFDEASPFYALLLMDGDRGGKLMNQDKLGPEPVSEAFGRFQAKVPGIVAEHDGVLIYAGADDVKAFLPLTSAIPCIIELHEAYLEAFSIDEFERAWPPTRKLPLDELKGRLAEHKPTISAGLCFAHHNVPLSSVIRETKKHLLDDVAKDGNGRNSLAIAVWKPSGKAMEWVSGFATSLHGQKQRGPIDHLMPLAEAYAAEASERSTSYLYNLRERYGELLEPASGRPLFDPEHEAQRLENILLAEWIKGRNLEGKPDEMRDARNRVRELTAVCCTCRNLEAKGDPFALHETVFRLDGGLIARFLADNGVGLDAAVEDGEAEEDAA